MKPVRFDLLPFLRVRFGNRLREDLESVVLIWRGEGEVFFETTALDSHGNRQLHVEDNCLSGAVEAPSADLAILVTLSMDDYSWCLVGDVFSKEEAGRIAQRLERGGDEYAGATTG